MHSIIHSACVQFKQAPSGASVSLSTWHMSYCPSLAVAAQLILGAGGIVVTCVHLSLTIILYKKQERGSLFSFRKKADAHNTSSV